MDRTFKQAIRISLCSLLLLAAGCGGPKKDADAAGGIEQAPDTMAIGQQSFGTLPDGREVTRYSLRNTSGMEIGVINLGGIITDWTAPDASGNYEDIVLGFDNLEPYLDGNPYFGALIGRYGNRIAGGSFSLDGQAYTLAKNNGENHLHGGVKGFDKVLWQAEPRQSDAGNTLELTYRSPDGEEGYPGNLDVKVTYTLSEAGELDILYEAKTDKPTVVNLTQHSYFNLSGDFSRPITDHMLTLQADAYLPVDAGLIPTGEIRPVAGTPFDFTQPKTIGAEIDADNPQISLGGGYDHCWILNGPDAGFRKVATVTHPPSGRRLEVFTDEPGVQFYTGNFLDGTLPAKGGGTYARRSGFCLETQHYPDSPNQEAFPSVRLDPGETYSSHTKFKLTTN
ncbi:galactose mutarotase [Robiginitalea sp. SC105]|nr:aldose epimerase family protein [Robiginitalea sp. SC105]MBC2839533.1 galactose mutarotase [Robiginitalea sp. SC105]